MTQKGSDNIKMGLEERAHEIVDWINLSVDKFQ
jgi:hypothetical protein